MKGISQANPLQDGLAAFRSGDFALAERQFTKALRGNPRDVGALNLMTVLLMQLKRFAEAEPYIRSAISQNGSSAASHYNYGLILKALKRPEEANKQFSQAIALEPINPETWNNRGTTLNDMNRPIDAIRDFVIPEDERRHYSEQVVYLPDSYMVNDKDRIVAEHTPTRAEAG